jgi:hypothetical protein
MNEDGGLQGIDLSHRKELSGIQFRFDWSTGLSDMREGCRG